MAVDRRLRARSQAARFRPLRPGETPGKAGELLGELVGLATARSETWVATMAHSPSVPRGYLEFSRAMKQAKLDRKLSELVSIAVQARLGCHTCLEAHVEAARRLGVGDDDIDAARTADSAILGYAPS